VARGIDYYDDPTAPQVNSMVPSVNVVVTNAAGEVLLIRRTGNGNWAVPGGGIDLGESMVQAGQGSGRPAWPARPRGIRVQLTLCRQP
jgi:hypothetical protein